MRLPSQDDNTRLCDLLNKNQTAWSSCGQVIQWIDGPENTCQTPLLLLISSLVVVCSFSFSLYRVLPTACFSITLGLPDLIDILVVFHFLRQLAVDILHTSRLFSISWHVLHLGIDSSPLGTETRCRPICRCVIVEDTISPSETAVESNLENRLQQLLAGCL